LFGKNHLKAMIFGEQSTAPTAKLFLNFLKTSKMKTTKYNGITYQLDESKFKPAYIKFDQDMFDDEIFPVLVGLGFEVGNLGSVYADLANNRRGKKFNFAFVYNPIHYKDPHPNRLECHTAQQFLEASGIFAVADELPKDWYIEVTEDNLEELDTWRKSVTTDYLDNNLRVGIYVVSKHFKDDGSYYHATMSKDIMRDKYPHHKKIDLETFRKITNMKKSFTITSEQAQSIINIACNAWKKQLAEKWANNIVLGNEIQISEEFYKEMRVACTPPQNELFDKIFGKDDDSVDLSKIDNSLLRSASNNMLDVRDSDEYKNKAFYLSDDFNWEIKRDPIGVVCLIPTKKC
jgi:hypothetical protein